MEEAATPLPSEETTPPVTNIYFGAIRIARAVTRFTAPDFSHLSGRPTIARRGVRGWYLQTPSTPRCQFQLFAPQYLKFFWRRNLFLTAGFNSPDVYRLASRRAVPRLGVQVSEGQEFVQLLFPTHAVPRGNPQPTSAI